MPNRRLSRLVRSSLVCTRPCRTCSCRRHRKLARPDTLRTRPGHRSHPARNHSWRRAARTSSERTPFHRLPRRAPSPADSHRSRPLGLRFPYRRLSSLPAPSRFPHPRSRSRRRMPRGLRRSPPIALRSKKGLTRESQVRRQLDVCEVPCAFRWRSELTPACLKSYGVFCKFSSLLRGLPCNRFGRLPVRYFAIFITEP